MPKVGGPGQQAHTVKKVGGHWPTWFRRHCVYCTRRWQDYLNDPVFENSHIVKRQEVSLWVWQSCDAKDFGIVYNLAIAIMVLCVYMQ